MSETMSPSKANVDERLRELEQRLDALSATLSVSLPARPVVETGDEGADVLRAVDDQLALVRRLASALDGQAGSLDCVDRATAMMMLRELATVCRNLRSVARIAEGYLRDAHETIRRNRSDILNLAEAITPQPPAEPSSAAAEEAG